MQIAKYAKIEFIARKACSGEKAMGVAGQSFCNCLERNKIP
jgi:hypothetical protein